MLKENYNVIGVMSGTSLDGVDIAHVTFLKNSNKWQFQIHEATTIPYSKEWQELLRNAIHLNSQKLQVLNVSYTNFLGKLVDDFIQQHAIKNLDAVCSHGHTILHQPDLGYTLQIGNLPVLANLVQLPVVCDFRVQDVALGGQGAPLVPIGDHFLFAGYDQCVNLGGFSNISMIENRQRISFDICPVNVILNPIAQGLGFAYDDKGALAKSGEIHSELLQQLNALSFYQQKPPKSLGMEWVIKEIYPIINSNSISSTDMLRTLVEHIAIQIAFVLKENSKVLFTGGGSYHQFLMERIAFHAPLVQIEIPEPKIIDFKEALIFGFLGVLKLRNEVNVLKSVTGASKDHSSGTILTPN
jgi:anhydro-N-acetylmuramic acid kinase